MKMTIYFDGACHLCSREISHYQKIDQTELLQFVNIADPKFDPVLHGLDPVRVNQEMHVRDASGKLYFGVSAFIEIWKVIPSYRKFVPFAENVILNPFLRMGYFAFARIRPFLPKRKFDSCDSGFCKRT